MALIKVGVFNQKFNRLTGQSLPIADIYQSTGLYLHIQKRHPTVLPEMNKIPDIISSPDYIGINPKENDSIELVKVYADNMQIAIKLDSSQGHYYVASMYPISNGKLNRHLHSGRLKKYK